MSTQIKHSHSYAHVITYTYAYAYTITLLSHHSSLLGLKGQFEGGHGGQAVWMPYILRRLVLMMGIQFSPSSARYRPHAHTPHTTGAIHLHTVKIISLTSDHTCIYMRAHTHAHTECKSCCSVTPQHYSRKVYRFTTRTWRKSGSV